MAVKTEKDLPANLKATWLKALSAMQLKNYGYTIQLVQTVLKQEPDFLPGRQLARKAAIAKSSSSKSLLGGLSSASFSSMKVQGQVKKDPKAALEAIEKILEGDPRGSQPNMLLFEAAKALNMPETGAFALETIIEANPKDTKTMHLLAKHYLDQDDPEKAVEVYNRITEVNPSDLSAVKGGKDASARASMMSGGWDREETTYRDLIKDKDEAVSLEQQSRVVLDESGIEMQLQELHQRAEREPENVDVARKIAAMYERKKDLDSAVQWFDYAAQLTGGSDIALIRKASDLRIRQYDEAIAQWEEYIQANPDAEEAKQAPETIEDLKRKRAELMLTEARKRVERNPTDLQFRYELGEILLNAGQHQEAIPELQRATRNPNVRNRALNLLGKCYWAKGMRDLAVQTFNEASSEIPAMDAIKKEIIYNLGLLHEEMGDRKQSIECMKQIYAIDYAYRDVAKRVESSYGGDS